MRELSTELKTNIALQNRCDCAPCESSSGARDCFVRGRAGSLIVRFLDLYQTEHGWHVRVYNSHTFSTVSFAKCINVISASYIHC